ncbi:MAG: hypothetical protein WBO77_04095 [Microgenomates group bacterium]
MLKEFIDRSRNIPVSDSEDPEQQENQVFEAFDSMCAFLRDPSQFPDTDINQLISGIFPENGRSPFRLIIEDFDSDEDYFNFEFDPTSARENEDSSVRISSKLLTHYKDDPIGALCQLVSVASVGSDLLHYRLPIKEEGLEIDFDAEKRSEAYIAQLLLTLTKIARQEKYDLVIDKGDRVMMKIYPHGLLSLPPKTQPIIIPDLLRVPFPEAN